MLGAVARLVPSCGRHPPTEFGRSERSKAFVLVSVRKLGWADGLRAVKHGV
jgi:hypothetical protein